MNAHHFKIWWNVFVELYDTPFHWIGINLVRLGDDGLWKCVWQGPVIRGVF